MTTIEYVAAVRFIEREMPGKPHRKCMLQQRIGTLDITPDGKTSVRNIQPWTDVPMVEEEGGSNVQAT